MKVRAKTFAVSLALTSALCLLAPPGPAQGAALASLLQTSAVIPAGAGVCVFDTGGPYAIAFPAALDPFAPVPLSTASVTFNVTCTGLAGGGKTVIIDRADGTQLFLKSGADKIPYSLNLPFSQKAKNGKSAPLTLTATIAGAAYQSAPAGLYSDSITIEVLP